LLIDFNPRNIRGEIIDLYGHQFVCLNPNHPDKDTPQKVRDWLDLIYQSIHNPDRPVLNIGNEGIKKAAELISFENLTPEERSESKKKEAGLITIAKVEKNAKKEVAKNMINKGFDNETVSELVGLTIEEVEKLRAED
jgi:hypothetical protein